MHWLICCYCCCCCVFCVPPSSGLLALSSTKGLSEELLLGLGEAAAAAAGDVSGFQPGLLLWSNLDSLADCVDAAAAAGVPDTAESDVAKAVPATGASAQQPQAAAMDVDGATDVGGSSSSSSGRGGVQEYLLAELGKMAVAPKEEVRWAGNGSAVAAPAASAVICWF
jgi:hypothetical protein